MEALSSFSFSFEKAKRSILITISLVIAFLAAIYLFSRKYFLAVLMTNSDYSRLMVCEVTTSPVSSLKQGQFISFTYKGKPYPQYHMEKGRGVIKMVAALPGDSLEIDGNYARINNELILKVAKVDSKGKPLPHFIFSGKVPEGKVFVIAPHPRSFDSRYWGFVDESWGIHKCYKIF